MRVKRDFSFVSGVAIFLLIIRNAISIEISSFSDLFDLIRNEHIIRTQNFSVNDYIFPSEFYDEFSYNENDRYGPSKWKDINALCDGRSQSPTALSLQNAIPLENMQPLVIDGIDDIPESIRVVNNGHSIKLTFNYENSKKIKFSGGPLENPFILDSVHFHWGVNGSGSEHILDGKRYAAELHMVTYNSVYESISRAITESNGLAVLGIFYDNDRFFAAKDHPWTKFISKVTKAYTFYLETNQVFSLKSLIGNVKVKDLLSYRGSLTTPGCSENVLWMVSVNPLTIKLNELYELSKLRNGNGRRIMINYRPVQELNEREVKNYMSL